MTRLDLRKLGLCGMPFPGTYGNVRCYEPEGHATEHLPNAEGRRWMQERKAKWQALVAKT